MSPRTPARRSWRLTLAVTAAALAPSVAAAQEDFRSADLDRPVRVEDASPTEFRAWEVELGTRAGWAEGPVRGLEGLLELKAGILPNTQVGVELEAVVESGGPDTETGLEAATVHVLYAIARETPGLPAVGVRLDISTPGAGTLRNEEFQAGLKTMLTRSVGRVRIHGNAGYTVASDVDGGDYWRVGLGTDYPIGLFSRALLTDVYAELPTDGGDARVWADLGARFQLTLTTVLDVGLATRIDEWRDDRANIEITLGFSRVFGFAPDVAPYPDPSIR